MLLLIRRIAATLVSQYTLTQASKLSANIYMYVQWFLFLLLTLFFLSSSLYMYESVILTHTDISYFSALHVYVA